MKIISKIIISLIVTGFIFTSCNDMLDVDYDNILLEEDYYMGSPNDTIYSMMGILKELEKLGDRYVILGELRGDLLEITENASADLKEIYDFSVSTDNPYSNVKDYYAVINRCNYLIHNIDTAIVSRGEKVMYKEFAAAKAIRAWTYLQLVLNHGVAKYYDTPLTSIQEAQKAFPEYKLEELLPELIADLEPWQDVPLPGRLSLGDDIVNSRFLMFPIRFVLGDLYLYNGDYVKSAQAYYDLMYKQEYLSTNRFNIEWSVTNSQFVNTYDYWTPMFFLQSGYDEIITQIAGSSEYGKISKLDSLFYLRAEMTPSKIAMANWKAQTYYHSRNVFIDGDLRGEDASYSSFVRMGSQSETSLAIPVSLKQIYMFTEKAWGVGVYRIATLYLRYAEAVNRAGKPNLAFAVLKNGLTASTLANDSIVPVKEKSPILPSYMDFTPSKFNVYQNTSEEDTKVVGIHARGCGNIQQANNFRIPSLPTLADSILYVEDKIMEEMALETAFEGNRFHDLIRVAKRRNSPEYLAEKAAQKYSNSSVMETLLKDEASWYLPSHE